MIELRAELSLKFSQRIGALKTISEIFHRKIKLGRKEYAANVFPFITSSESFFLLISIIMTKLSVHLYLLISLYLMVLSVERESGDASDPSAPVIPLDYIRLY